jgi:hypothetical protein
MSAGRPRKAGSTLGSDLSAMTNAEALCDFMESGPTKGPFDFRPWRSNSPMGWWKAYPDSSECPAPNEWVPVKLTLGRLHEVEARLTEEQWWLYESELSRVARHLNSTALGFIHASAEQKIAALATVLRAKGVTK